MTPKSIDILKNELGGAFTILKSTHFAEGQQYGYLACVIPEEKYRIVIEDPFWVYVAPVNPGAYVTPHMVTNSLQERGLPIWEIFCPPSRSSMGTPRMVMGIGVFAFP